MKHCLTVTLLSGLCLSLLNSAAYGAEPAPSPVTPAPAEYRPSMGDLMTMAVQPRHLKLGLAGQQQNWDYARYEVSELRNAFARIARTIPVYSSADTAALVAAMITEPINAVQEAIAAGDARQFKERYARLTQACNACHQAQAHASVVITVPDHNVFADQDFRPVHH